MGILSTEMAVLHHAKSNQDIVVTIVLQNAFHFVEIKSLLTTNVKIRIMFPKMDVQKIVKLRQVGIAQNHFPLNAPQFVEISSQLDLKNVILAKLHLILNAPLTVSKTKLMKLE